MSREVIEIEVKVSEAQVNCLEVASQEIKVLIDLQHKEITAIKDKRDEGKLPTTGSLAVFIGLNTDSEEAVTILSRMASALREGKKFGYVLCLDLV